MSVKPCAFCGGSLDRILEVVHEEGPVIVSRAPAPFVLSVMDCKFLRSINIQSPDEWLPANARRTA